MGRGDFSHITASIISRVNTVPKAMDNKFYFLGQVLVHTLDTLQTDLRWVNCINVDKGQNEVHRDKS